MYTFRKLTMTIVTLLVLILCTGCQAKVGHFLEEFRELFDQHLDRAAPPRTGPKQTSNNCTCGQINTVKASAERIINGTEVNPKYKYPWLAIIIKERRFICGGSLINHKFVLTAAHCLIDRNPALYEVITGVHYVNDMNDGNLPDLSGEPYAQRSTISHIKFFGTYNNDLLNLGNDVVLLKLITPVMFTKQVSPVCLPKYQDSYTEPERDGIIMGWGRTELAYTSNVPNEAVVQIIGPALCRSQSLYGNLVQDTMICASAPGKDFCQRDSGGPLVVKGATSYIQVGIASWGIFCAREKFPGVFTTVANLVNKIYAMTRGGIYCRNPDVGL